MMLALLSYAEGAGWAASVEFIVEQPEPQVMRLLQVLGLEVHSPLLCCSKR